MNRINQLLLLTCITIVLGGSAYAWYARQSETPITSAPAETRFTWGVGLNPTPTREISPSAVQAVIDDARELGVNTIRVKYIPDPPEQQKRFDLTVDAIKNGTPLEVVAILEHDDDILNGSDPYRAGYNLGYNAATRYKGKVQYYQMGNELAAYALKPSWGGHTRDSYVEDRYQRAFQWLKGMSKGIRAADPNAKRLITGHFMHYAFWDRAKEDGLQFEVVGWDWFHEELPIPSFVNFEYEGKSVDLVGRLAALAPTLWITEAGVNGNVVGYDKAASYLSNFIKEIRTDDRIKGLFVVPLTDEMHNSGLPNWQNGLIGIQATDTAQTHWKLSEKRSTFYTYQKAIRAE